MQMTETCRSALSGADSLDCALETGALCGRGARKSAIVGIKIGKTEDEQLRRGSRKAMVGEGKNWTEEIYGRVFIYLWRNSSVRHNPQRQHLLTR